jgi:hypothetical protein
MVVIDVPVPQYFIAVMKTSASFPCRLASTSSCTRVLLLEYRDVPVMPGTVVDKKEWFYLHRGTHGLCIDSHGFHDMFVYQSGL